MRRQQRSTELIQRRRNLSKQQTGGRDAIQLPADRAVRREVITLQGLGAEH